MDERDVITSLNELDDLIADARRRRERATGVESGEEGGASAATVPIPYAHTQATARPLTNILSKTASPRANIPARRTSSALSHKPKRILHHCATSNTSGQCRNRRRDHKPAGRD